MFSILKNRIKNKHFMKILWDIIKFGDIFVDTCNIIPLFCTLKNSWWGDEKSPGESSKSPVNLLVSDDFGVACLHDKVTDFLIIDVFINSEAHKLSYFFYVRVPHHNTISNTLNKLEYDLACTRCPKKMDRLKVNFFSTWLMISSNQRQFLTANT